VQYDFSLKFAIAMVILCWCITSATFIGLLNPVMEVANVVSSFVKTHLQTTALA